MVLTCMTTSCKSVALTAAIKKSPLCKDIALGFLYNTSLNF